jgi:hypothetical protein
MTKLEAFTGLMNKEFSSIHKGKESFHMNSEGGVVTARNKGFVLKDMTEEDWVGLKTSSWTENIGNGMICINKLMPKSNPYMRIIIVVGINDKKTEVLLADGSSMKIYGTNGKVNVIPAMNSDIKELMWNPEKAGTVEITIYGEDSDENESETVDGDNSCVELEDEEIENITTPMDTPLIETNHRSDFTEEFLNERLNDDLKPYSFDYLVNHLKLLAPGLNNNNIDTFLAIENITPATYRSLGIETNAQLREKIRVFLEDENDIISKDA